MRTLTEQLSEAHKKSGLTVAELLKRSGLDVQRSSLQRKLSGDLPLRTEEAEALARALGIKLTFDPSRAA